MRFVAAGAGEHAVVPSSMHVVDIYASSLPILPGVADREYFDPMLYEKDLPEHLDPARCEKNLDELLLVKSHLCQFEISGLVIWYRDAWSSATNSVLVHNLLFFFYRLVGLDGHRFRRLLVVLLSD